MDLIKFISNPLLLMFLSIFLGQLIGKINFKNIKLGSSGGLFVGIFISYCITVYLQKEVPDSTLLQGAFISSQLFNISLIGFIAAVGLLAAKNIKTIIKNNGYSFMILAFVITATGALTTWGFVRLVSDMKASVIGTYVGALTSSPGLATALEAAKEMGGNAEAMVGLGYSISYIPGVVLVIIFAQLLGKNYKNNEVKQNATTKVEYSNAVIEKESNFCIISFSLVCILGLLIGKINVYLGSYLGFFSLGSTGGVLISALLLGNIKKIGFLNFNMLKQQLFVVRDISLNMFLSIVGLNYGYNALNLIRTTGGQLLLIGIVTASFSILVGYIVGKKVLKLSTVYLLGGICGGMTSTPGLAASIEALDSDEVTAGYGATYPFALFFMILFTNILSNL
ncbi:aspartate-alanine antiporter-like transporter [Alkaliphilus hydrothermalis]|uniref:Transport protein n=1 Tax=Alkaliphilus hydrothermalis TaxID=1482730 RepID=A0ABS2NR26_9FIRM|nr:YidE/YbjL duplication [Alkaliphilus hydrothermalis]MBM7615410.1 putative transport protein [Alkaliphilus hydrothermalis]